MQNITFVNMFKTCRAVEPIVVTVLVSDFVSDADLKAYAMKKAGETPESLFGSKVEAFGGGMREIHLFRD